MKIAIATDNNRVAKHFGRCPNYTIATIEDNEVSNIEVIPNPGHEPGFLPQYLFEKGVECIIAGGMGPRAEKLFVDRNIHTIVGVTGNIDNVVHDFKEGKLKGAESLCHHE